MITLYLKQILGPQYWMASHSANRAFMEALLEEAHARDQKIGIYSSKSQWVTFIYNLFIKIEFV
jgi:hypothetical protein